MLVSLGRRTEGVVRRPLGFDGERDWVAHVQKMEANEVKSEAEIGIRTTDLYKIYTSILYDEHLYVIFKPRVPICAWSNTRYMLV